MLQLDNCLKLTHQQQQPGRQSAAHNKTARCSLSSCACYSLLLLSPTQCAAYSKPPFTILTLPSKHLRVIR
jgi:hypothetical protein